ncbi:MULTISPECIES: GGDEF domain-containing protein, partial [unclassified Mesorhizobium]|uniref:GGDEF domain-containing protein n=1 Tax=unclassified Mesorhizobium TaxID=325217 RepID=UPI0004CF87BC
MLLKGCVSAGFHMGVKFELAVANHKLADAATIDRLAMCLNRGAFSTMVEARMFRQSEAEQAKASAFLVIDADHFKSVNDRFGHDQGDEALRLISAAIRSQIRSGDLVGRLGGEEFGVYLPGADQHEAALVAERIRDQVKKAAFRPGGKECVLTVSVGGATFSQAPAFAEMFRLADERLYDAKHAGRDRVRLVSFDAAGQAAHASYLH